MSFVNREKVVEELWISWRRIAGGNGYSSAKDSRLHSCPESQRNRPQRATGLIPVGSASPAYACRIVERAWIVGIWGEVASLEPKGWEPMSVARFIAGRSVSCIKETRAPDPTSIKLVARSQEMLPSIRTRGENPTGGPCRALPFSPFSSRFQRKPAACWHCNGKGITGIIGSACGSHLFRCI